MKVFGRVQYYYEQLDGNGTNDIILYDNLLSTLVCVCPCICVFVSVCVCVCVCECVCVYMN